MSVKAAAREAAAAAQTGTPPKMADSIARLAPGYVPDVGSIAVAAADGARYRPAGADGRDLHHRTRRLPAANDGRRAAAPTTTTQLRHRSPQLPFQFLNQRECLQWSQIVNIYAK